MFLPRQKIRTVLSGIWAVLLYPICGTPLYGQEGADTASVREAPTLAKTAITMQTTLPGDTVQPYYYRVNGAYLKTYWTDFKYVTSSPFHWKGRQWAKFAAITGATGVVMLTLDEPFQEMMLRNQSETFKSVSEVLYPLGNRVPPLLLTGMYLTSLALKNRRMEHASLSVAKSLAISTIFYTASKSIIRRQRPTRTDDPYDFVPPFTNKGYTSFPSGHTNTAFSVATAISLEYNDRKWVPWVAYTLATLTSVSRMYDNRHWFSDVIIGASIGHFVTRAVYRQEYKRREAKRNDLKIVQ